jgi:hypothetical protein
MKIKKTSFVFNTNYDTGIGKFDVITLDNEKTAIVISKIKNEGAYSLKAVLFVFSKYKIWNTLRLFWLKIRVFFNLI